MLRTGVDTSHWTDGRYLADSRAMATIAQQNEQEVQ